MRRTKSVSSFWLFVAAVAAIVVASLALPTCMFAQSEGQNAVYYLTSQYPGYCCDASSAFIDASPFGNSATNFCSVLNGILNSRSFSSGGMIDARGLPATGTSMTCSASPWGGTPPTGGWPPAIILLPATGGTSPTPIIIQSAWVLPANTHLIGEGDDPAAGTTIQVSAGFGTSTPMIQFGNASFCSSGCTGISVESLILDGKGASINGISNQYAGAGPHTNSLRATNL